MGDPGDVTHRTFDFEALDGARLVGDLALPSTIRSAAVLCHPHPQFGGDRFNTVISALYDVLPAADVATLRFDFRSEYDNGVGERLDALAALDQLAQAAPGVPLAFVGYSFGAWVALGLTDDRIDTVVAIAPPLAVMSPPASPVVPTLVLTPAHDQFSPPDTVEPILADWRTRSTAPIDFEVVEMADHFLAGRTATVAERTERWLAAHR